MRPYGKDVVSNSGYKYILISGYGIMALVLCLLFGIWFIAPDQSSSRDQVPTNYVRGVRILAFESPAMAPRRDLIVIHADGEATRSFVSAQETRSISQRTLSQEQRQAIDALRTEWCDEPPRSSVQPFYDIRVECGIRQPRHVLLPKDDLPPILATLVETLPAPQ